MGGCEAVMYYSGVILEDAGVDRHSMLLATVVIGCVKTSAVIGSGALVDTMGRRPLLLVSSSCMCIAMATLSIAIWKQFSIILEVAALCLFVVGFSIGFGPIVYVLNSEIYPQHWRSVGLSLAMGLC